MERNQKKARAILRQLERLAAGRANDAVKLLYLDQVDPSEIDGLDLNALTEFKRGANGAVELKFTDRAALLERIYHLLEREDDESGGLGGLLRALDGGGEESP